MRKKALPKTTAVGVKGVSRAALDGVHRHFANCGHVLTSDAAVVRFAVAEHWQHVRGVAADPPISGPAGRQGVSQ